MKKLERREVLKKGSAYTLFFGALFGGGIYISPKLYAKNNHLRPPGALDEKSFLATCIKCGQCMQVCPYHSINMYDITNLNSIGTPYIDAHERGCYLCDLFPCILACPTGSLQHEVTEASDIHMGTAYIDDIDNCLAFIGQKIEKESLKATFSNQNEREAKLLDAIQGYIGKECTICADMCPYPDKTDAIEMVHENSRVFPKINQKCVGCGVCAELCPSSVISVASRKTYEEVYT
ncbi:MAG: 4Fe-4S dicluster domain-containing protein [Campylobacteraceae bacterium]|jgi:ferredoxin-type protein NapG|nr:4Fe-4S dicluster domain-containing protein [Campylobacteraceae bacterium]